MFKAGPKRTMVESVRTTMLFAAALLLLSSCGMAADTGDASKASGRGADTNANPAPESPPSTPHAQYGKEGHVVEDGCKKFVTPKGTYLYYSPTDPSSFFCTHPSGQSPRPIPGGGTQMPPTCAAAPDGTIYCVAELGAGETLRASALGNLYFGGLLPDFAAPGSRKIYVGCHGDAKMLQWVEKPDSFVGQLRITEAGGGDQSIQTVRYDFTGYYADLRQVELTYEDGTGSFFTTTSEIVSNGLKIGEYPSGDGSFVSTWESLYAASLYDYKAAVRAYRSGVRDYLEDGSIDEGHEVTVSSGSTIGCG